MPKTEVILIQNVVGLGAESDQVKVAAGFARNYLIPQRLAIPLTSANKRRLEVLKQRRADREAHELNTMTELGRSLAKLTAVITVKTGDDGKMHGAVTSGMIADQLKTQFDVTLDKRKIHIEKPIRALGEHEVDLHLHQDVDVKLKVRVESSTPPAPVETAKPGEKKDEKAPQGEARPERRERRPRPVRGSTMPESRPAKT
jgi:large subunit ribosomal protein L9